MLLASIDLEQGPVAISRQMEEASSKEIAAWENAKRTLTELLLVHPNDIDESTDHDGRSLWVGGKPVFELRTRRFPEKIVVTADWKVTAKFDSHCWLGYILDEVD